MTDAPDTHPERAKLNDLVTFAEKRTRRALERLRAAEIERDGADLALVDATHQLNAWIEANPDPQMELI